MTRCPPIADLERLLAESLDDAERAGMDAHIEGCQTCQLALQRLTKDPDDFVRLAKPSLNGPVLLDPEAEFFFDRLKRVGPKKHSTIQGELANRVVEIDGYDIVGELGRGAAGVVYKARYRKLDRLVALKVIQAGAYLAPEMRQRFRFEAQAVAKLKHPNIVQIYDVGEHANTPYMSLELIEGGNLAEWLAGRPRSAAVAANVIVELAKAVEFAHRNGVVHRDLKPANVLLSIVPHRRGKRELKVTDFGIAKLLSEQGTSGSSVTQTGEMLGTPAYMAPEQIQTDVHDISPATDVYSMGAILYEMLTGRPPFQGATALDTLMQTVQQDPVAVRMLVPGVPRDLETICLKCLEKDPLKRYRTAASLAADVGRFLRSEPIHASPLSWAGHTVRWVRRHKVLATALASAAALAVLLTVSALIAGGYFRALERQQHALAEENQSIANDNQIQRDKAIEAGRREVELRRKAESASQQLRENLYYNQMQLGSQAAASPSGIGRIEEWLAPWPDQVPDPRNWEWYYLNGLCHRDRATMHAPCALFDVAWQPQGRLVASGGFDGVIRIWDTVAGEEVQQFYGHAKDVVTVAWSPDAHRLASASTDGTVKIWNATSGQELLNFRNHIGPVSSVAWSPDGTRIASCGLDQTVQIWNAATGQTQFVLRADKYAVLDVCWSPDGTSLASSVTDGSIHIWNAATGGERQVLLGHVNFVNRITWSHSGRLLASASNDLTAKIWDVATGRETFTLRGNAKGVKSVAFSPDDQHLATCGDDQTIKLYTVNDGRECATLRGHTDRVLAIKWSPDGKQLVSASMDHSIKFWNPDSGEELPILTGTEGPVNAIAWSPTNRELASVSYDNNVRVWNIAAAKQRLLLRGHTGHLFAVSWSADGLRIASAGEDHTVRIWDAADGHSLGVLPVTTDTVLSIAWSPDGQLLASAGDDKLVRVWNTSNGTQRTPLIGHSERVLCVAWSSDGRRLASGSADQTAILWDLESGKPYLKLEGHTSSVAGIAWSPDDKSVATAGADQMVKVWDTATARPPVTLKGHTTDVTSVSWSPDGTRLASGSEDRTLKLWDVKTGHEALSLDCRGSMVRSIAWSPDGTSLAAGLEDHTIAVYDAQSGYAADRSPQALPALDRKLVDKPDDVDGWHLRAEIDARCQDWIAATADIKHSLALSPNETWEALGNWSIGPYPAVFDTSYPPEKNPNLCIPAQVAGEPWRSVNLKWQFIPYHPHDYVDLGEIYDHAENISAYTLLKVYSAKGQKVGVLLGSDDQNRVWLNGTLIHERKEVGRSEPDSEGCTGTLNEGWNDLLVRVVNMSGAHTLNLRLTTQADDLQRLINSGGVKP